MNKIDAAIDNQYASTYPIKVARYELNGRCQKRDGNFG